MHQTYQPQHGYLGTKFDYLAKILKTGVLRLVWLRVLFLAAYAAGVVAIHKYTLLRLNLDPTFITVVNVIVSLILAFRTNAAYDRYWEGRRLWGTLYSCMRNLGRLICVNTKEGEAKDIVEKKQCMNLLAGFVFSVKHHLRNEFGFAHDDMRRFVSHLKRTQASSKYSDVELSLTDQSSVSITRSKSHPPLELTQEIGSYLTRCKDKGLMDIQVYTAANNVLLATVDTLSSLERILTTPLPLPYTQQLAVVLWMYLLLLPFQMVKPYDWWSVLIVALSGFCFLGIKALANEIENPFGTDENDLKMEAFCEEIKDEIESLAEQPPPKIADWNLPGSTSTTTVIS